MARVIVDPDEVRNFVSALDNAAENLEIRKIDLINSFEALGQVWRDPQYQQFENVFEESAAVLTDFLRMSERYSNFLSKKARKVDKYLEGRY